MITQKGKAILGKYLAGQNDSTFSYIALGVGAVPAYDPVAGTPVGGWEDESGLWDYTYFDGNASGGNQSNVSQGFVPEYNKLDIRNNGNVKYSSMKELDFEVVRVPITESGVEYVESPGDNKYFTDIILTATVPSFDHYKFTEVGVYSAEGNAVAITKPSQLLFRFSPEENWAGDITVATNTDGIINVSDTKYYPYSNTSFNKNLTGNDFGSSIYAECRIGSWCLLLNSLVSNSVESFGFGTIRPDDEFRLAYFLSPNDDLTNDNLTKSAKITFTDRAGQTATADFVTNDNMFSGNSDLIPTHADFGQRYGVGVITVSDFTLSNAGFSWTDVRTVRLEKAASDSPDIFVDALRFVSTNYNNPNYGLIAYSTVQNRNGSTPTGFVFAGESFGDYAIPEALVKQKGLETLIQYRIRINESLNGEDYVAF